jgi:uncharacterized damage-inducible protein DinB
MIEALRQEFDHEARTTRRLLERIPEDKMTWRPHVKSFTAGMLASHIVDCLGWADAIFTADELVMAPSSYRPFNATSTVDLLTTFDRRVANYTTRLAEAPDEAFMQPWRLRMMGAVRFEKSRLAVFRDFTLNHLIHHRGQLSVYLRLLDVPVPGAYGPTADETS